MPLNKQQLEVVNQANFPDNNSKFITPALLRDFNTDMIDAIQLTGSYATTGSNTFVGNQTITGNLSVSGVISASILHVQTETASVIYSSGSNQLGDELTDIQTLSGSVKIQGQLLINGIPLSSGSGTIDTGSLVNTASFNAYTSSTNLRLNSLETNSASVNVSISNLNTTTASLNTSITNLNAFSASQRGLNGTFATTGSNTFTGNQVIDRASKLYTNGIYWTDVTAGFNNLEIINQGGGNLDLAALNGGKVRIVNTPLVLTGSALTSSNDISTSANIYAANLTGSGVLPAGVISSSAQITSLGFVSSSVTASSLITASFSGQTLTFTKGNGTTFGVVIPDVSGSDISALNAFTASQLTINAGYNTFTQSANVSISALNSATSSYVTETESGSFLLTASFDNGTRNLTFTKGNNTTFAVNIPDVSGSAGNFVTTSSFNAYTQSNDQRVSSLETNSASVNISISNINTTTASLLIETQNLELFSASALTSLSNLNTATSSLFTSASLSLTTASVSGTTMTFTKGNGTTFNVTLPAGSGSVIDTGSFATTGSNSFNGSQIITGSITTTQDITVSGVRFGFGNPAGTSSIAIGNTGTLANNIDDNSIAIGYDALQQNTTGERNIGIGTEALRNIRGNSSYNVAIGGYALSQATSSTNTFALGYASMENAQNGNEDIAIGVAALYRKKSNSNSNTAIGSNALREHYDGDINGGQNMAFGLDSMRSVTSGSANTTIGTATLRDAPRANENVFIGWTSGYNAGQVDYNTVIGARTAPAIKSSNNTIIGHNAANTITSGSSNTIIGKSSGENVGSGSGNTFIGVSAGSNISGSNNTLIGTAKGIGNWNNVIALSDGSENIRAIYNNNWTFTGSIDIQNTLTASLQQGYVWVGDSTGRTITVATSSFGGGGSGSIDTSSFATTGSNTFTGTQTIRPTAGNAIVASGSIIVADGSIISTPRISVGTEIEMSGSSSYFRFLSGSSYYNMQLNPSTGAWAFSRSGVSNIKTLQLAGYGGANTTFENNPVVFDATTTGVTFNTPIVINNGINSNVQITGSLTTNDVTITDPANNFYTIADASGSMMLVAKGFTSASAHISASSAGIGNFIFKTNSNTPDTVISGSANIFSNAAAATAGFKRYVGGSNNIYNTTNLPQLSGSMQISPTFSNNYFAGQMTMRGPISSSSWTIAGNTNQGIINIGSSAIFNAEKLTNGLTMTGNNVNGTFNIIANQSALTGSTVPTTLTNNIIVGTITLFLSSSTVALNNNIINDGGFTLTNQYYSSSVGIGNVSFNRNNVGGQNNQLIVSGAQPAGTTNGTSYSDNFIGGANNIIYADISNARVSGSNAYHSVIRSVIFGNSLIVSASSLLAEPNTLGSAFFGRFNDVNGTRDLTAETVFAVGTGTSTSTRKTGFLIDSGSNTFVEGSLNVSGSTSLTGSLTIQSGSSFFANGNRQFNVGAFTSLVSQSGSANVSQSINFETTDISSGVSIASNSRITLANSGTYNIQFSAQIDRVSGSGTDEVYFWLKKNGVNVTNTAGVETISGGALEAKTLAAWNYVVEAAANDYYELVWQSTDTNIHLTALTASGNIPAIPSVILTVTQVR